jgi:hypothetical protein
MEKIFKNRLITASKATGFALYVTPQKDGAEF